ncbi:MAG: ribonuclease HI [Dehalococcoidia bacterium]|nr:ribonuclease HI [Dehalococcoidia bacterium]
MAIPDVMIYTDGACLGNPGPGGYGAIIEISGTRIEKCGGFRLTTNNRMEIMAAIAGLELLRERCRVFIFSDSQYLVRAMTEGWVYKWQANGWMRNKKEQALNPDLWERLLKLSQKHEVEFRWVRGHNNHVENERCDRLANEAAQRSDMPADTVYESQILRR